MPRAFLDKDRFSIFPRMKFKQFFLAGLILISQCFIGENLIARAQQNQDEIKDAFKNVDILAPFKGVKYSWPGPQSTAMNAVRFLGFDTYNRPLKDNFFPKNLPEGKIVRGRSLTWRATKETGAEETAKFKWGARSVSFQVIEYNSLVDAEKALTLFFSKDYKKAIDKRYELFKKNSKTDPYFNKFNRKTETSKTNLPPGSTVSVGLDGTYNELSFDAKHLHVHHAQQSWMYRNVSVVTAGNKPNIRNPNYRTEIKTLVGSWASYKEKSGFARRGRFILAAGVDQSSNWTWDINQNTKSPAYPDDIWLSVASMLAKAHEGKKLPDPNVNVSNNTYTTPVIGILRIEGEEIEVDPYGTGDWIEVTKDNIPFEMGPNGRVITGFDSKVTIDFAKRGLVTVKELSNYAVGEFLITDEGITAHTNMKVGEVNVKVDRKYKAIDFSVSTGTVTSSVRNTDFTVTHAEFPPKTTITVHSGRVEVTPTICSAPARNLTAGQRIAVDKNCFGELEVFKPDDINEPGIVDGKQDKEPVELAPIADSHIYAYGYRNWNKSNWGKYEALGAGWHPDGGEKRTFLKFDLSSIDPDSFEKATLKLFHVHTGGSNAVALGVHRVTSPWVEGIGTYKPATVAGPDEITWVNQPTFDPTPILGFNPGKGINKWIELDITSLVKSWLSRVPNHGLIIKAQGPLKSKPESQYGFRSREFQQADKHPVLVLSGSGPIDQPDGDITWDFETGNISGWVKTGTAFDFQPTYGDNPTARHRGQPSRHAGNYWIGGFEKYQGLSSQIQGNIQGDGPTGTLTSKAFTIPSGFLSFLIGGGSGFKTRVELLVAGKSFLHASGRGNETMHRVTWDLSSWAGQTGQIRIVDNASGGWGHINADDFKFSATTPLQNGKVKSEPDRIDDEPDTIDKPIQLTKKAAYAQYIAAYNKLNALMSRGKADTPAAQRAYQEYKKAKDIYEAM